ncbi:MAG: 5-formyltetrahydrofolate cyclo-ligase [Fusobacteriaceae bacterium]|jgi:5-formyltetrahydrofolate cyclo-ligase|nr:5-formyltetrahydrofolate cyclo-ligase [Fusobacteriaceae bacterium]
MEQVNNIQILKNQIRAQLKEKREQISFDNILKSSDRIAHLFLEIIKNNDFNSIMSYCSFRNEVDTDFINKEILKMKKILILPKIENNQIIPIRENSLLGLKKNKFGIYEPDGYCYTDKIDMIIVPGIGFDKKGNRIGFGKGYYDKFLKNYKTVLKIALAFEFQIINNIPTEEHDIKINKLISEKKLYHFSD